ncbi:MAG: VanZ family protein [Verrucomicrobiota bacterium]
MPAFLKLLQYWLPPLLWMYLIFSGSGDGQSYQHSSSFVEPFLHWLFPAMPLPQIQTIHYLVRKGAHMAEYALLAGLLWRAIRQTSPTRPRPWIWGEAGLALGLVFLYAASDELHQTFIPGRTGQASDVAVDVAGAAVGLALLWAGKRLTLKRNIQIYRKAAEIADSRKE